VKYAHFLMSWVFPAHDALCAAEGALMLAWLAGDRSAAARLAPLGGQAARLYDRLWGAVYESARTATEVRVTGPSIPTTSGVHDEASNSS